MQNQKFDPERLINFNIDYYNILGINKNDLPEPFHKPTREEQKQISKILDNAWRKSAIKCHFDMPGGSEEAFKLVIQAHTILSDYLYRKYYESKGIDKPSTVENCNQMEIDWDKLGTYRKGTTEDTIGFNLFLKICDQKEKLGIIPAFYPQEEFHNYEWDFLIKDTDVKLSLSLVHDENEIMRLTGSDNIQHSLPFKIYICIPRAALQFLRSEDENHVHKSGTVDIMKGQLKAAIYSDYNLLETTSLDMARKYIEDYLENDIISFKNGGLVLKQEEIDKANKQLKWMDTNKIKQYDLDVLKSLLRMKTYKSQYDENAADFLNNI